jgi:ATP-binding cassette, subfamily B, bacterial
VAGFGGARAVQIEVQAASAYRRVVNAPSPAPTSPVAPSSQARPIEDLPSRAKAGEAPPSRKLSNLALLWGYARGYPAQLVAAFAALLVAATATLAIPQGFKLVVDKGFGAGEGADIAPYFWLLLGIVLVMGLATAVRFYFVSWIGERIVADLRQDVQAHLLRLDPGFFELNRPSEIASRLTADTGVIEGVVGSAASVALRNLFMGVGGLAYLFYLSPKLTGLMLIVIPVVILPIVFMGRRVRTLSQKSQDRVADVGSLVSEVLRAIKVVQAFGAEAREAKRFANAAEDAFAAARRRIVLRALMTAIVITLVFGAITLVLWEGARDVIAGTMTGGTITAFVLAAAIVAGAFGALTEVYGDFMRAAGASARVRDLLAEAPGITAPDRPVALPEPPEGRLDFEGITFHYPSRPDMPALRNFNLSVRPGERIAIVGPSGAGKSTLFQLVQRFYDPLSGRVLMDAVDLREADPAAVRARIAVVPQEAVVFMGTARSNILYGRPDASETEIWSAAEAANAAEFIRALPQGLDSDMGEGGTRLSGGQRQRIAIARALLKDAPILLLDEATSALDAESEAAVQDALEHLMRGRTSLVIAHRLATVRNADRIVVMDDGAIVEIGTHDQLVSAGGLYSRLAGLQFGQEAVAVSAQC